MSESLPPIETPVLVTALDALPARLRKKLDDAAAKFADRPVARDGDRVTVTIDDATTVTLVTVGGVVRAADAVTCTCLLAPNCLHRAAVLTLAPVRDDDPAGADPADPDATDPGTNPARTTPRGTNDSGATGLGTTEPGATEPGATERGAAGTGGIGGGGAGADADADASVSAAAGRAGAEGGAVAVAVPDEGAVALTAQQSAAVAQLWRAAVSVLAGGVTGSGAVARAALLRAAHEAQACKVYRAAAAARVVATLLQAARSGDANYRLADLTEALRELLGVAHRLRTGPGGVAGEGLLGSARRQYHLEGSLRLYGLCTTAVLAGTGHAGVVTYAADRQGRLWMIADVMPGDARRAARGGDATIAMGETALTHRGLTRAGLVVSGATAAGSRQLGAGRGVRAVTASGAAWHEEPLARLWAEPVEEQVHRAFEALAVPVTDRPAGADLLFLRATIRGTDGDGVAAETAGGMPLMLRVASEHPALGYRENLRVLGRAEGLDLLLVARPDPGRPGTVLPLAVAPAPAADGSGGAAWNLPASRGGHADLAFDRLHRSQLPQPPQTEPAQTEPAQTEPPQTEAAQSEPAQTEPAQTEPAQAEAAQAEPVQTEATQAEPARSEPEQVPRDETRPDGMAARGSEASGDGAGDDVWRPAVYDPALQLLTAQIERTVAGGRVMLTFPSGRGPSDAGRLRRARLDAGAALLDRLTEVAVDRPRDAFGRLADDDGTAFAQGWLAAATYADAAGRAFAEASWLTGDAAAA